MPTATHDTQANGPIDGCTRALRRAKKAWASWRDAARNAHLAAVMGTSLTRHCRHITESSDLTMHLLDNDEGLQQQLMASAVSTDHANALQQAIRDHIQWLVGEIESGITRDIKSSDPMFDVTGPSPQAQAESDAAAAAQKAIDKVEKRLETARDRLTSIAKELQEQEQHSRGYNAARSRAVDLHREQLRYVTEKASELAFCDDALTQVANMIAQRRDKWTSEKRDTRGFFMSKRYKSLASERKSISSERTQVEIDLQSYFDHHAHGAAHSDSVKPDRQTLRLAQDLEKHTAGFKQVQNVDMYCPLRSYLTCFA